MDRRSTPATARVAHISLRGKIDAPAFVEGEALRIGQPLVDLLRSPGGPRERQLWLGETFTVIDREAGHAFGFAAKDGYCGWLPVEALANGPEPSHWVATPGTHLYEGPKVQARDIAALPMGAAVAVIGQSGAFAETSTGFAPLAHLWPLARRHSDPVTVAERFLGTPYLWGGNSRAGLDCSGLVQGALLACGIACPADSDQQEVLGDDLPPEADLRRGDLLFWKGHVALVVDETRMIHANGHSMSVAYEPILAGSERIAAQGGGPVTHRRTLSLPSGA